MAQGPYLFDVDTRELRKLEKSLLALKKKALPFAARETINGLAFEGQAAWRRELPGKMRLRNKWTERSIRVEKEKRGLNINTMKASVGSTEEYMREQEFGATLPMRGREGFGIPAAAPGQRKNRPLVPKRRQLSAIKLLPRTRGNRAQRIHAAMHLAKKRGSSSYAFLRMKGGRKGIYELNPGKRRLAIRKIWDLSKRAITKPKNPTMTVIEKRVRPLGPGIYREALIRQLRLHKAFGY